MTGLVWFIWALNFVISIFNAWGCGRSWTETKAVGGFVHFMNWMGAIMSACGFTWCYTLFLAAAGASVPFEHADHTSSPLLDEESFRAVIELGYVIVILPMLGSGLAITLETWAYAWRRRTFGSAALTGYNTLAQMENIYSAAQTLPGVFEHLSGFFGGGSSSDDKDDFRAVLVGILVAVALFGGVLTTAAIIGMTARAVASERAVRYHRAYR